MKDRIKNALIKKYEGDIAAANANIEIYLQHPVGIGEHSDVIAALDEQIGIAATAEEKLNYTMGIK
jgi:hypothetical protein|tara:strand:- start:2347 stop:2544 length:198 start_codon:yes stop_codon:yes gene_type:complete